MADPTEAQLKAAARKAVAAGDTAAARRLIAAARKAGSAAQSANSPAMAEGMSSLSAMSRNPTVQPDNLSADLGLNGRRADPVGEVIAPPPHENTVAGTAAQFGVGTQSGIANALGFPVDAMSGAIGGLGELTGMWGTVEKPFLGSAMIKDMMAPINASISEPQSAQERIARRVGEEVGSSTAMAPVAALSPVARSAPLKAAAVEAASALGSGTGAAVANEVAPGSMTAEIVGALLGGVPAGMTASRALDMEGAAPVIRGGIEDQKMRAADAYGMVRADPRVLPQDGVDDMALGLSARMDAEGIDPDMHPSATAVLNALLRKSSDPMRIENVENLRRITQRNIPLGAAPEEGRLAGIMKDEITRYIDDLNDPVADALRDGRTAHRRAMAATAVEDAAKRAESRAARTGSGGNEINAMRQNLSSIVETPRKARSFTPDELADMQNIVLGTTGQNAARRLSRFAPSTGGLSAMLGIGGAMASPAVALPLMAVTEGAKALGERSTKASIAKLLQSLAPDRVLKPGQQGIDPVIAALLAGRTTANAE